MPPKQRVWLIHWKAEEGRQRIAALRAAGYQADLSTPKTGADFKAVTTSAPAAIVIDLTRQTMEGRNAGVVFRRTKSTRHVPLVFVEGDADKVARIRATLPDATYTTWARIRGALAKAIANPPAAPVTPDHNLAGYSGTPLPKKLGIKTGSRVALPGAPDGFAKTLGNLPDGAVLKQRLDATTDLVIWFVRSARELRAGIARMAKAVPPGGIWIAWPKQASGVSTDVTQPLVRELGLSHGIVDYKICAIDATWSGLKFARRKST